MAYFQEAEKLFQEIFTCFRLVDIDRMIWYLELTNEAYKQELHNGNPNWGNLFEIDLGANVKGAFAELSDFSIAWKMDTQDIIYLNKAAIKWLREYRKEQEC